MTASFDFFLRQAAFATSSQLHFVTAETSSGPLRVADEVADQPGNVGVPLRGQIANVFAEPAAWVPGEPIEHRGAHPGERLMEFGGPHVVDVDLGLITPRAESLYRSLEITRCGTGGRTSTSVGWPTAHTWP